MSTSIPGDSPYPAPSRLGVGRTQWVDFAAGARAIAPLDPGSFVFGLAVGALVQVSGYNSVVGMSGSLLVNAGASQIAIMEGLRIGAPLVVVVLTALVINSRLALYSAAVSPAYSGFPRRWKLGLAYLMTDQAAAITLQYQDRYPDPVRRRWFVLGASLTFSCAWFVGTAAGILLGPVIPSAWQIGFIVPLMFISLMVPSLRHRAEVVAAVTAIVVAVVFKDLPLGLNVIAAALAGIGVGRLIK
ncbi:AzlC family ABC transporter permease [Demequina aurantiaca]|uniref:AzlC family ABC transporter permease n=1 Tax=Demequina aurantiaca TaxID=676200 RepID=UPI000783021C|nr:AzlC family ABC transporter permease [Demequina aurantiaca]